MMIEPIFVQVCRQQGIPMPEHEWRFHPERKWRFDWAWPQFKVALEVEGGVWTGGAHGRGTGITRDIEKYNQAAALGWLVLRCQPRQLYSTNTLDLIRQAIQQRPAA